MVKILSVDGGGIKGVIAVTILDAIQKRMDYDKPLHEKVDIITGTSTGGLIACALTAPDESGKPKFGTKDLINIYRDLGETVFSSSFCHKVKTLWGLVGPRFPLSGLDSVLEGKLGKTKVSDALTEIVICTYDLLTRAPVIFSSKDGALGEISMKEASLGTASVPSYFPSVKVDSIPGEYNLIDGGIFAVNPALSALSYVKSENPEETVSIVSIGNGNYNQKLEYKDTKDWGMLQWAFPVTDVIIDSSSDAINFQTRTMCEASGGKYVRLQFDIPESLNDMADASAENIENLRLAAQKYVDENPDMIDAAVEILKV